MALAFFNLSLLNVDVPPPCGYKAKSSQQLIQDPSELLEERRDNEINPLRKEIVRCE